MAKQLLRAGASAWAQIESARLGKQGVQVISGMRDHVARSISLIVFMADFFGHTSCPLNPRAEMSADYVVGYLQGNWRRVLEGGEPQQTFEWLLWFLTDAFRTWFAWELGEVFGVDVLSAKFVAEDAAQRIRTDAADIFIYRAEDMVPSSPGHARLLEETGRFLNTPVTGFPSINSSDARRSSALSEQVRREFWLPGEMLDTIYSEPIVRHFYSADEIAHFRHRWSGGRIGAKEKTFSF